MSEAIDRTRARLENIRSVEPILAALRTISMGRWKAALYRRSSVLTFNRRLERFTASFLPLAGRIRATAPVHAPTGRAERVTLLVFGSERGLCGAFNRSLAEYVSAYMEKCKSSGESVQLLAAGAMTRRYLNRLGVKAGVMTTGFSSGLPSFETAVGLSGRWLSAFEAFSLDRVDVVYNAYHSAGRFEPRHVRLIPAPELQIPSDKGDSQEVWPEPIIEGDPAALLARVLTLQVASTCYQCILESAAAENAARYQLLEDARQNIERLVAELEAEAAQAQRQAITREIQNLAVGAGLLGD